MLRLALVVELKFKCLILRLLTPHKKNPISAIPRAPHVFRQLTSLPVTPVTNPFAETPLPTMGEGPCLME